METIVPEVVEYDKNDFINYLDKLRTDMAERGLTQEIVDEILNES